MNKKARAHIVIFFLLGSSFLIFQNFTTQNVPTLYLSDFGAIPDDSVDDTIAIQDAFQRAADLNGAVILNQEPGTYILKEPLKIGKNTHLISSPGVKYLRSFYGSILSNNLGDTSSFVGYEGNGNIVIDGGVWDFNGQNFYQAANVFAIGYADGFTLKNATVLNVVRAHVIDLSSSQNVTISYNKFLGFAHVQDVSTDNIGVREYSEVLQIDSNTPISFGWGARNAVVNRNVTFRNNFVGPNPELIDKRFGSWGVGVGGHSGVHDRFHEVIRIENNTFQDMVFAGVRLFQWNDVKIIGNVFNGGIRARGVHATISSAVLLRGSFYKTCVERRTNQETNHNSRKQTIHKKTFFI